MNGVPLGMRTPDHRRQEGTEVFSMKDGNGAAFRVAWMALWLVGALAIIGVSWHMSDAHVSYALDDPFIHLAVATASTRRSTPRRRPPSSTLSFWP